MHLQCEDAAAQATARAALPLERLRSEAAAAVALNADLGEDLELSETDLLVQGMALWFKSTFMTWVVSCERG